MMKRLNAIVILYYLIVVQVFAQSSSSITLTGVLSSLNNELGGRQIFFKALFYATGLGHCLSAIMRLKKFGHRTAFMHVEAGIVAPAAQLFIGVALIYSPQLMDVLNETFWMTDDNANLGYTAGGTTYEQLIRPMKGAIIIVGLFAFFRGWLILARSASQGQTQPGTISKGITHVFVGAL